MTEPLTLLLAALGVVAAMLAVLVPVVLQQSRGLRREFTLQTDALAAALAAMTVRLDALAGRMDTLTTRVDSVAERVVRIEGALTGPWRPPANGNPTPSAPAPAPAAPAPASTERAP